VSFIAVEEPEAYNMIEPFVIQIRNAAGKYEEYTLDELNYKLPIDSLNTILLIIYHNLLKRKQINGPG